MHNRELNALQFQKITVTAHENATPFYTVKYGAILGSATISTSTWSTNSSNLAISNQTKTNTTTSAKFTASHPGKYTAVNKIIDSDSEVLERKITIVFNSNTRDISQRYYSGTATTTGLADLIARLPINVKDPAYGAVGDGVTDDSAAIQLAIDAATTAAGTRVDFPNGSYNLGTTALTCIGNGVVLEGYAPRFVGSSTFGVELLYGGTGAAVTFGSAAAAAHYRNGINNIQIRATGDAKTSATATGLRLINQHYLTSTDLAIKDFLVGTGLLFEPLDDGVGFGALNNFRGLLTHLCKIGIKSVSISAFTKENVATFYGGATIHNNAAGSIGCDLDQYTDGFRFYGTDFESAEIGVKIAGSSNHFECTRSEYNTNEAFHLTSTATRTNIIGHQFAGSATLAEMIEDNAGPGLLNWMINENGFYSPPKVQPLTDKSEAFYITKADGTTVVLDVTTSGAAPQLAMVNGADILGWSDAFSTLKYKITGSTGDVKAVTFTASGTPVGVNAGEIQIGGSTSATVGAAGGASALPATPLGYVNAYVAGVAVKIPYYTA